MPKAEVRLCEVHGAQVNEAPACILPISDHDVLIGKNEHGTFATWNLLNPDSPVSPGFAPAGIKGLRRLYYESEKIEHIFLVAQMIIELFKAGIDALSLQEVPSKAKSYFKPFMEHLESLAHKSKIELDLDAFQKSYALTQKPARGEVDQGYHGFATALLFKHGIFTLNTVEPLAGERGSSYNLTSAKSGEVITVINLHGDYGQANQTANFITSALAKPNTIVLGDTNIALTKQEAITQLTPMKGILVEPSTNIKGTAESSRTLDCFLTNIQSTFYFKKGCKNLTTKI